MLSLQTRNGRVALIAGLIGLVAIFLTIAVVSSDQSQPTTLSTQVESVSPTPGGLQRPQADITVDLADGFTGRLSINGQPIPDDQLVKVESLGQYLFRPGPGKAFEIFEAGTYTAEVFFWPVDEKEPSTPQSYVWTFRVTS